jgi:hypothetical protein
VQAVITRNKRLDGCDIVFLSGVFIWKYQTTACGDNLSFFIDFVLNTLLLVFMLLIDGAAYFFMLNSVVSF